MSTAILPANLPGHPRLFLGAADWAIIRARINRDPFSAKVAHFLRAQADELLSLPTLTRDMEGIRLLRVSRWCLARVSALALTAKISGDQRYAARAIDEMLAVARFSDWNPAHFLDTAEMACAVALGYDWLYDDLAETERDELATALKEKAILPSFHAPAEYLWWIDNKANWNQVCHAGISLAALATAEREPDLAEKTLRRALDNIPHAAHGYAPDGAYIEGTGYWGYGTAYHVVLAAALEHLTGSAQGLDTFPGFRESAEYLRQVTSPRGEFYNYSDSGLTRPFEDPLFWFARRFHQPGLVRHEVTHIDDYLNDFARSGKPEDHRFLALALIWHAEASEVEASPHDALYWIAQGPNPIAVFRSAWNDPRALYVAIKGGSPQDPHAHMDAGSFILEANGVRWAVDLGSQDYHGLESAGLKIWASGQDSDRWKVFRLGPAAHNILRFGDAPQQVEGRGELVREETGGPTPRAMVTLDSLYRDQVRSVRRRISLLNGGVLIEDEWQTGAKEVAASWPWHTRALPEVGEDRIILRENGEALTLLILEPRAAQIDVFPASSFCAPHDAPNPHLLQIRLSTITPANDRGTFRVLALPGENRLPPSELRLRYDV